MRLAQKWLSILPLVAPAAGAVAGGGMKAIDLYGHHIRHGDTPSPDEQHLADRLYAAREQGGDEPSVNARSRIEDLRHDLEVARLERESPSRGVLHGARKGLGYGSAGAALSFIPAMLLHSALVKKGSAKSEYIESLLRDAMTEDLPRSWARYLGHGALVGGAVGGLTGGAAGASTADPGDRLRRGTIGAIGGAVVGAGSGVAARGLDWRKARRGITQARGLLEKELRYDPAQGGFILPDLSSIDIDPIAHTRTVIAPLGVGAGVAAGLTSPRGHKEKK